MSDSTASPTFAAGTPGGRRDDIDQAKGLAILLVVIGHIVAREPPHGNEWYVHLKDLIYQFHMPFFVYLSGFVVFYTGAHLHPTWSAYWRYVRRRAARLLVPFLVFGVLILVGKVLAAQILTVDNQPASLLQGLRALVWDTSNSPAASIWYLYVIFLYCLAVPLLLKLSRQSLVAPLLIAGCLLFVAAPEWFYLDRASRFLLFFLLGGLAAQNIAVYESLLDKWTLLLLAVFLAALLLLPRDWPDGLRLGIIGSLALPALHAFVRALNVRAQRVLLFLGTFSLVIYLFNTILIGVAKGVLLTLMSWDGANFLVFAPLLLVAGLFGPILLKVHLLRRYRPIDGMTS